MVQYIRDIEIALGDGIKQTSKSEEANKMLARKSVVANRLIKSGETFNQNNLDIKRPANGLSPMEWDNIIGKIAKRDFQEDEPIEL